MDILCGIIWIIASIYEFFYDLFVGIKWLFVGKKEAHEPPMQEMTEEELRELTERNRQRIAEMEIYIKEMEAKQLEEEQKSKEKWEYYYKHYVP